MQFLCKAGLWSITLKRLLPNENWNDRRKEMKTIIITGRVGAGKTVLANALEEYYKREKIKVLRFCNPEFNAGEIERIALKEKVEIILIEQSLNHKNMIAAFKRTGSLYRVIKIR